MKKFAPVCTLLAGLALLLGAEKIQRTKDAGFRGDGEHPGYFEQWMREKSPIDGKFPHWMRAKWAAWDRSRVRNRAEDIIDAIYELGPRETGGRTRSVWIDPRNENIMLAAAISGGVWRTENAGASWKALNDNETSLMASCIASDPSNPDIIYYGTGEARGNSADVNGNGVYKSIDGGKSFSVLTSTVGLSGFDAIWDLKHSADLPNTIFVGTNTQGLWRSKDAGQSWEQVFNGGNKQVNNILTLPGGRVLISMQSNLVYASDSNGNPGTFAAVSLPSFPLPGKYRRIQMAACDKYPNVVYALVEAMDFRDSALAFYKSRDGGRNWEKMPRPTGIGPSYQGYCIMLGAHPTDSTRIVGAGVRIAQSNDGGKTWRPKKIGHSDHHGFAAFPVTTSDYLASTDGGVYRYGWDDSLYKQNLNNDYNVTQFYAGNFGPVGPISISGAQDNGTQVATGPVTTKRFFGADGAYAHIGLQDGSIAYFSTQDTGIRRISNFNPYEIPKSSNIKKILDQRFRSDGVDFINSYTMNPGDQNQLYYRTNLRVFRTLNRGDNWDVLTNNHVGLKPIAVSNETNPTVYAGGSSAQLYKVDNAATATTGSEVAYNQIFPAAITNDFLNAIAIDPKDKYTIYIAFSNYSVEPRLWKLTGMNGTSPVLTNISGDLPPGLPVNYVATDPKFPGKNMFAATDFGLYYSTDSGKSWVKENRIPNVAIHEIKMRADGNLFVYTHGRGMWAIQLKTGNPLIPAESSVTIYPNPTSDILTISLSSTPRTAEFEIYDAKGAKVMGSKFDGYKVHMDMSGFRDGCYYVRVITDKEKIVRKILLN